MAAGVAGIGPSKQDPLQTPNIRRNPAQRASSVGGKADGVYNAQGQVSSFTESKSSGADAKRAPAPGNSTYNAQGQVKSSTESKASSADNGMTPGTASTYNAQGQVVSKIETIGSNNGPRREKVQTTTFNYNSMGQVNNQEATVQAEGVPIEEGDRERSSGGRSTNRRIDLFA